MTNVVSLKPKEKPARRMWYCVKCEDDRFWLYVDGTVYCAGCKAEITSLVVGERHKP